MAKCSKPVRSGAFFGRGELRIRRNSIWTKAAALAFATSLISLGASSHPTYALSSAGGDSNHGDVWVDNVGQPAGPGHEMDPHLQCADINLWGNYLADGKGTYTIDGWSPSGSGFGDQAWPGTKANPGNASWSYNTSAGGDQIISVINVKTLIADAKANGDLAQAQQGFHFKLQFSQDPQKHKTFWVNCDLVTTPSPSPHATPTPTPTVDCDGDNDGSKPNSDDKCTSPSPTPGKDCDGDGDGSKPNSDDRCTEPTPTPTPTSTPSSTPHATPTPSNVPTPTPSPSGGVLGTTATPDPTPHGGVLGASSPDTGSDLLFYLMAGAILIALGGTLIAASRRRDGQV